MLKVHILTENTVRKPGMYAEHGLSLWIEKDDRRILFDTGQSSVFIHNAKIMRIDLTKVDFIILSHGHYDHSGGLAQLSLKGNNFSVYGHPDLFQKKFARISSIHGTTREIGVPWKPSDLDWLNGKIIYNRKPYRIDNEIMISGEILCLNDFEKVSNKFLVQKENGIIQDKMLDEQVLIIEENDGIAVFLGCSHPGVVNCLGYVQRLFPYKKIILLVAGMHLETVSSIRLQKTIEHIIRMDIEKVVPLHCTGFKATYEMKRILGDRCLICSVGDTIEI